MSLSRKTEGEAFLDSPAFERALANDDGSAAKEHLAAGFPIYVGDPSNPGKIIKKFPDGRRQLVTVNDVGVVTVLQEL
jgi:hypothetical protein